MSDKPYIGRCERCAYAMFATAEQITDVDGFLDVKPGVPYRVGNWGIFARCDKGHKVFRLKQIKGTYSADHKCDARCLNAKGNSCTCSCGGMNHGRGHAVTLTASREPRFLGEIGKHIRGSVTVEGIWPRESSKLYTLRTNDGDKITWWVRPEFDPQWEKDDQLVIRGKVKDHRDAGRFGKETVLIYVEEVNAD